MKYLVIIFALVSSYTFAGGWATPAVPIRIDVVQGGGFMIYGAFGNPGNCTIADKVFVEKEHPQYNEIYATVLAEYMSGKRVQPYAHSCKTRGWYVTPDITFNTLTSGGSLNILGN
jgi:hypothetical protein